MIDLMVFFTVAIMTFLQEKEDEYDYKDAQNHRLFQGSKYNCFARKKRLYCQGED